MSRVTYNEFQNGNTKKVNVFEIDLGKILLVEDPKMGGFTSFFKPDLDIVSEGETKEEAVINLLETYNAVLNSGNAKLKSKKILPK